jgi:formyl-CoA transferase
VVGNVSAFGGRGPDAQLAGMDLVVQARSGLMATTGRIQNGIPTGGEAPIADYTCAMALAFGVAAALLRRERTGRGGEVDAALLMAALLIQNNSMLRVESVDGPAHAAARRRLAELRADGRPYAEQMTVMPTIRTPAMTNIYYRVYATRDAAIAVACGSPALQRAFIRALGLTDAAHAGPVADPVAHYAALRARAEATMASRTTAEWKTVLDTHGVPAAGVRLPLELLDDEQALANGFFHDLAHPALGTIRVLAPPVRLDGAGFRPGAATGSFGSETRAILGSLGFDGEEIGKLVFDGVTAERLRSAEERR